MEVVVRGYQFFKKNLRFMNTGHCASLFTIQNARKWPDIAAQYCAHVATMKKDVNIYIANRSLNVNNTNVSSSQQQWSPTLGLQMFLDFNFQKSWPAEVVVKASGSCRPIISGGPRLGTTATEDLVLSPTRRSSSCQDLPHLGRAM